MTIKETINNDLKNTMLSFTKSHSEEDKFRVNTLRSMVDELNKAEIANVKVDKGNENAGSARNALTDEQAVKVLTSMRKKLSDSHKIYADAGKLNVAHDLKREVDMISVYLPAEKSEEEVRALVAELKDKGFDFKAIMAHLKTVPGVNMRLASQLARS